MELKCRADYVEDFAKVRKEENDVVCIWIGTIWDESDNEIPFPQLMILRRSVGMGGKAATPGAYERVGILCLNPSFAKKTDRYSHRLV